MSFFANPRRRYDRKTEIELTCPWISSVLLFSSSSLIRDTLITNSGKEGGTNILART